MAAMQPKRTDRRTQPLTRGQRLFRWITVPLSLLLVSVLVFAVFLAPRLDETDYEWMTCTVVSSELNQSPGESAGRFSITGVTIHTENCGEVLLQQGVTADTAESIANETGPGSVVEFEFGWLSRHAMNGLPFFPVRAQSYSVVQST